MGTARCGVRTVSLPPTRCGRSQDGPHLSEQARTDTQAATRPDCRSGAFGLRRFESCSVHASVAQWQSRAAPPHRHGFDSCRPHQQPFAWEANLVKARPSEAWLRQDVEAAERWARNLPQAPCHPFAGSDPPFSPSLRCTRSRRVWPPWANPIGARAGSAYLPCKEIELGSSPR